MPGVYKIPMVRMTEMSDETPECKGLKVPHSEMGVWVKAQAVRFSRNGCYETPWHVTGVSKLTGLKRRPKGICKDRIVGTRKGSELSHLKARGRII